MLLHGEAPPDADARAIVFFPRTTGRGGNFAGPEARRKFLAGRRPGGVFFTRAEGAIFFKGPEEISLVAWRKFSLPDRRKFFRGNKKAVTDGTLNPTVTEPGPSL